MDNVDDDDDILGVNIIIYFQNYVCDWFFQWQNLSKCKSRMERLKNMIVGPHLFGHMVIVRPKYIIRIKWPFSGSSGGALWSRACPQNILCWWKKLSGESIVSVSPDNLWIIDSRISSIAKTRAVGPKLQNIKLFQIRRQNKRARSAQNGGVKPINATAFENKLQLYNSCWCKFNEGESHTDLLLWSGSRSNCKNASTFIFLMWRSCKLWKSQ